MTQNSVNVKIGGRAGEGIKVSGLILTKCFTRQNFSAFSYQEYPSLIRGGHNSYQVYASKDRVYSQVEKIDILVAFDDQTSKLHQNELTPTSLVIYDPQVMDKLATKTGQKLAIPLKKIASENGNPLMANSVALGAIMALLCLKNDHLWQILKEVFGPKGESIVKANQKSIADGYDYALKNFKQQQINLALPVKKVKRMVITGNEATALGALAAGLKFYCAYPMTPATSILHFLAANDRKAKLVVKQPEDEITAINQTVAASFAGVRAMTATSGGGFCLMTEGLGMSGVMEVPVVIVNSMRPGPASGMPTWSGQGDLKFIIHAAQDEFPRLVLAPGDAQECFELTKTAFDLAEKYQLPAIILLDKNISESYYSPRVFQSKHQNQRYSLTPPKKGFLRYQDTDSGISPRCFLGEKNGHHLSNSYEHSPDGLATESGQERIQMMDKRQRKFESLKKEILPQLVLGNPKAKIGLISWGSNKGVIQEALKNLPQVKFLHLNWLWPFPQKQVDQFIQSCQKVLCLEANSQGQLASLIQEYTGKKVEKFLKYNGRPFYPHEVIEKLNN